MNITKNNLDELNAVVTIEVTKDDYAQNVDKVLEDYRKKASIPGFRKGAVPKSLIQKQYGKTVLWDEINKLLQDNLNKYLTEERIALLGNPIPKMMDEFDFNNEVFTFEYELGLTPEFHLDLSKLNNIVNYKVVADDATVEKQVAYIQKQDGKIIAKNEVEETDDVAGFFKNEEKNINYRTTFPLDIFASADTAKKFIGKKVGDSITLATKGLFEDDHKLMDYLNLSHDDVHGLDVDVTFTIDEVIAHEPATLDQELFDKLFGPKVVTSISELKDKIKESIETQFHPQVDQKFMSDVVANLIEGTKFDLPGEFLTKWIQFTSKEPITIDDAAEEYKKSENGIRYELIETKLITENNLQTTYQELVEYTKANILKQLEQFGQSNLAEEEIQGIVTRLMKNEKEMQRLSQELMSQKLLQLYKQKVSFTTKEVSIDDFHKALYGELNH